MERTVVLASHGELSSGLKNTVSMIAGDLASDIETYSLVPGGDPHDFAEQLAARVQDHPETEFVVLTDIYGASVCTAMAQLLAYPNAVVFSGMNLAMLLSVLIEHPGKLDEVAIERIVSEAQTGVRALKADLLSAEAEDDF